jgi:rubredoxin-NAD+ reductase
MPEFKRYVCVVCGWIYEEEHGDPDSNLAPGTRFEDIPEDWSCPDCGASKDDFELIVE